MKMAGSSQNQRPRGISGTKKRAREASIFNEESTTTASSVPSPPSSPGGTGGSAQHPSTSNFRLVSACNRCRHRKNRCDQALPQCGGCARASVPCVGFDPVSKRTIPRSYVYYLETRVRNLELLLVEHGVDVPPPEQDFPINKDIKPGVNVPFPVQKDGEGGDLQDGEGLAETERATVTDPALFAKGLRGEDEKLERLVTDVGMVSVHGAPESRASGSTAGISFARVVFAAVRSSVSHLPSSERRYSRVAASSDNGAGGGASMRESFFGLHTKTPIKPAPFPDQALGKELAELYFEYANPQIPILHRGEFMALFERVYATDPAKRTPRESYLLNIIFAIGSGIIFDPDRHESSSEDVEMSVEEPIKKRARLVGGQHQPEEYHARAMVHLESFLGSTPTAEGTVGGLEELQAVLLLASLALLRPIAPGLWYIVGVATRLAVDMGLYSEESNSHLDDRIAYGRSAEGKVLGRKQWTRDLRRRLWWCVYAFDRIVSTCVGRPFGVTDQVVTTEFPSLLDDRHITTDGFLLSPQEAELPSYKLIAQHYLRLRLLQSEILQVLQHRQAEQARMLGVNRHNPFMHTHLPSPFVEQFASFRAWRMDVDRRLWEWKESAPRKSQTGVAFNPLFLELNYWQAIITLYRQSLAVPEPLVDELSPPTGEEVHSPGRITHEAKEDEQMVFMKVAQAGQTVLKLYRKLHRLRLVNYTFLATHHLFMSGISFLYAIWHSTLVRSQLTLEDVQGTVLTGASVLTDLITKCPPAEACRDAFVRMSNATITMVQKTSGFGSASTLALQPLNSPGGTYFGSPPAASTQLPKLERTISPSVSSRLPRFDMNLSDLFSDDELAQATRPLQHRPSILSNRDQRDVQGQPMTRPMPVGSSTVAPTGMEFLSSSSSSMTGGVTGEQLNWKNPWNQGWTAENAVNAGNLSASQSQNMTPMMGSSVNSNLETSASQIDAGANRLQQQAAAVFDETLSDPREYFSFADGSGEAGGMDMGFMNMMGDGNVSGAPSNEATFFDPAAVVWDWDWDNGGVDMLGGFFFGGGEWS